MKNYSKIIIISIFITLLIVATLIILLKNIPSINTDSDITITASTISNSTDKDKYYGKIVTGYNCTNNDGINSWKIFYADENHIYLIADNYISYDYCPSSATQSIKKFRDSDYMLSFKDIVEDYNESYYSLKLVSYLLDKKIWNVYAGDKAEYAIGTPTIDMLLKSYNEKYGSNYVAKSDELGYRISNNNGSSWDSYISFMLNSNDNLYVINSSEKATQMILASPSCYSNRFLMSVNYNGTIGFQSYDCNMVGIRPVVCLKSDTILEKQENNTYCIL